MGLVLALIAGTGVAFWAERTRYERFSAYLQAKTHNVTAGREARIAKILVREGSLVTAGQPLIVLSDEILDERLAQRQREVNGLLAEIAQAQARVIVELEWRHKEIQTEIFDTKLKSANFLQSQFSNQIENLAYGEAVRELGATASVDDPVNWLQSLNLKDSTGEDRRTKTLLKQQAALNALEVSSAQVELCEERIRQLEKLSRELPEKIRRSNGVSIIEARLEQAQAELASLTRQKTALTLNSTGSGLVGIFHKSIGDHVHPHESIVQVIDEEQPYLVVQIPSQRVADFVPGTTVALRFPGGIKGKGRVQELPPQTSPYGLEKAVATVPFVNAHIAPAGTQWPNIPFGSVVEVRRRK